MPAVNNVLVVGGGARRRRHRHPPRQGRRRRRPDRDQARRRRPRLRHHPAGQRAARAAPARRLGRGAGGGLRLRRHRPARARPGRHAGRRDARRQDRRPRPAGRHGHAPPGAGPHPARPRRPRSASSSGSARRSPSSTQDDAGVDVTFSDGSTGRYDLVVGADGVRSWTRRALGIDLETQSIGMGIWRAFGPRPGQRHPHRPYYGGPSYIAGYCPTGEDSLYAYIVEDAQDRSDALPRRAAGHDAASSPQAYHGPWDEIRENLDRPGAGQLHLVRDPRAAGAVEPRPGRAHRRRRAHLPAHHRPGRRAGPRGRRRARRAAARSATTLDQDLWDAFTARRFERAKTVVEASNQLAQWQLDHVQGDVPGLMRSHRRSLDQPARLNQETTR